MLSSVLILRHAKTWNKTVHMGFQAVPCTRSGSCWREHQGEEHPSLELWNVEAPVGKTSWVGMATRPLPHPFKERRLQSPIFFKASRECNVKSKILWKSMLVFHYLHNYQSFSCGRWTHCSPCLLPLFLVISSFEKVSWQIISYHSL